MLYALPVLAVTILVLVQLAGGVEAFIANLFDPTVAQTLVILIALLGLWRLIAMGDALFTPRTGVPWRRQKAAPVFAVLAGVVLISHLWIGSVTWAAYEAGTQIFVGDKFTY
jgi:hypothetical protein